MKTYLYRASNMKSHHFSGLSFKSEVSFWRPLKTFISCDIFIIIVIIIKINSLTSSDEFSQSMLKQSLHHLYH